MTTALHALAFAGFTAAGLFAALDMAILVREHGPAIARALSYR